MDHDPDTIVAIATPPGQGGIGVVRVSGPGTREIARSITGRSLVARHATLTDFLDAEGQILDSGIALLFSSPASFTPRLKP
jgi:tRNA modification GTPase